jgi:hypothetical protein
MFLEHAINDPPQRFEVKKERDYFAVSDVEVWWVRAKEGHDIPVCNTISFLTYLILICP